MFVRFSRLAFIATLIVVLTWCCAWESSAHADDRPTPEQLEFFEKSVRPLLVTHCYECHSVDATKLQAGLLVDSRASLLQGGDSGAAIQPHDADASLLIEAVRYESYEMPPRGKLSDDDIAALERWVNMGAPWPEEAAPAAAVPRDEFDLQKRKSEFWVWQPVQEVAVPTVVDTSWPKNDIDRFILKDLENAGFRPAPASQPSVLLRRLYFDLIGLPPDVAEVERFLADNNAGAVERLVDQLLASPHFGERWGRHWLDLVRYAESRGHEFDNDTPNAFQYRDYVIRAFNADVPYDQFVREHIAGDLLPQPRLNPQAGFNESILGTGFWFLGEWVHSPVDIRKDEADRFDNMLDVMSKTFLGVTVACARCHDHKFDAISTADYYSLSGFLQSSDYRQVRFESMEQNRRVAAELAEVDAKYQRQLTRLLNDASVTLPDIAPFSDEVAKTIVVDYATLPRGQFMQNGFIFGQQPRRIGQTYPVAAAAGQAETPQGESAAASLQFSTGAAVSDPFWDGLVSVTEAGMQNRGRLAGLPRPGRTLRTPTFDVTDGRVSCRVNGPGHVVACVDSHRLIAGPLHGQTVQSFPAGTQWVDLDLSRYRGHRVHLEFTPAEDQQLEVVAVLQSASPQVKELFMQREAAIAESVATYRTAALSVLRRPRCDHRGGMGRGTG
jgi:cytochrome c553